MSTPEEIIKRISDYDIFVFEINWKFYVINHGRIVEVKIDDIPWGPIVINTFKNYQSHLYQEDSGNNIPRTFNEVREISRGFWSRQQDYYSLSLTDMISKLDPDELDKLKRQLDEIDSSNNI
jgi:hypothetical protein